MFYFPSLRRILLPALIFFIFVLAYRSSHRIPSTYLSSLVVEQPIISQPADHVLISELTTRPIIIQEPSGEHVEPSIQLYYQYGAEKVVDPEADPRAEVNTTDEGPRYMNPANNRYLRPLLQCPVQPNKYTNHIRLPHEIRDISMVLTGDSENEKRSFLNAAILSLPFWSENQYLLVSRVQTDGSLQLNIICEANICYTDPAKARPGEKPCTDADLALLNGAEGMRCATPPLTLNVPPTPAKHCGDGTGILMDVPGFHDPRIFWTGKGEPLMILNSQSRYACFGLWAIDLRLLHSPLRNLLSSNPKFPTMGPLMSYPSLTELTRNPPWTRGIIEKNWMMFSTASSNYIHYDLGPSVRSFAKLLGGGLTTPNLTDPLEQPCLLEGAPSKKGENYGGSWHQGTNSLKLILCERTDSMCRAKPENTVFWSLIHHKHKNYYQLPLRYERYFILWSSTPPFSMLAMSSKPILFANETAGGWDPEENWDDDPEQQALLAAGKPGKDNYATFSYSVSIAYAWGRFEDMPHEKNTGYLDDEVIIGLGVDDAAQYYARIKVSELLQCLRICPPRAEKPLDGSGDPGYKKHKPGADAFNENKFGGNEGVDNLGALGDMAKEKAKAEGKDPEAAASAAIAAANGLNVTATAANATETVDDYVDIQDGAAMVTDLPDRLKSIYAATGELPVQFHDKEFDKEFKEAQARFLAGNVKKEKDKVAEDVKAILKEDVKLDSVTGAGGVEAAAVGAEAGAAAAAAAAVVAGAGADGVAKAASKAAASTETKSEASAATASTAASTATTKVSTAKSTTDTAAAAVGADTDTTVPPKPAQPAQPAANANVNAAKAKEAAAQLAQAAGVPAAAAAGGAAGNAKAPAKPQGQSGDSGLGSQAGAQVPAAGAGSPKAPPAKPPTADNLNAAAVAAAAVADKNNPAAAAPPPGAPNPASHELGAGSDVQGMSPGQVAQGAAPPTVESADREAVAAEALKGPQRPRKMNPDFDEEDDDSDLAREGYKAPEYR